MRLPWGSRGIFFVGVVLLTRLVAVSSVEDFGGAARSLEKNHAANDSRVKVNAVVQNTDAQDGSEKTVTKVPMDVRVEQRLLNTTQQNAIIAWDPPTDPLWERYDVSILVKRKSEPPYQNRDCKQNASKLHECVITSLAFGANYTVTVIGISNKTASYLSGKVTFHTLSEEKACLEYTYYNFTACPPETPVGVETEEIALGERHVNGTLHDIIVTWTPSTHPPPRYVTRFRTWVNNTRIGLVYQNVSGSVTRVKFASVLVGFSYDVSVLAYSRGGSSGWGSLVRYLDPGKLESSKTSASGKPVADSDGFSGEIVMIVMAILTLFVILTGLGFIAYHRHTKKKRYEERCRYFQGLDQKTPVASRIGSKVTTLAVRDKWEIPFDSLLQGDILGEGAFGVVRKGLLEGRAGDKQPLLEVAVKMVRDDPSPDELRQFLQEIEMMKSVGQHQNIVSIIGCCTNAPKVMLVTEYCAKGDLQRYLRKEWDRLCNSKQEKIEVCDAGKSSERVKYAQLALTSQGSDAESPLDSAETPTRSHKRTLFVNQMYDIEHAEGRHAKKDSRLTSKDLLSFARQITVGMEFLAGNRVVHRDLAARNVLVCADRTVKISDFGLSRDIYEQNVYRKKCTGKLPIKWMAIESLLHQVYTTQSDVWSFGVLLWEIVTLGGNPYPSSQTDSIFKLLKAGYRMERPANCSKEIYDIMLHCWELKPRDRPTFSQLRTQLGDLLESSIRGQYLDLDQLVTNESPQTSTSTMDHNSRYLLV